MTPVRISIAAAIGSLLLLLIVLELIRGRRLKERYALLWLATGLVLLVLSLWRGGLNTIAGWLGVSGYPPAILFAAAIMFVIAVLLHYSTVLSKLTDDNVLLAQEVALLRARLDAVERSLSRRSGPRSDRRTEREHVAAVGLVEPVARDADAVDGVRRGIRVEEAVLAGRAERLRAQLAAVDAAQLADHVREAARVAGAVDAVEGVRAARGVGPCELVPALGAADLEADDVLVDRDVDGVHDERPRDDADRRIVDRLRAARCATSSTAIGIRLRTTTAATVARVPTGRAGAGARRSPIRPRKVGTRSGTAAASSAKAGRAGITSRQ